MRKRDALKLHKGDEVIIKRTGEPAYVISAYESEINPKNVIIECDASYSGYSMLTHRQVS